MANANSPAQSLREYLLIGTVAIGAALASIALFILVMGEFAMARFREPWIPRFGVFGSAISFTLVALASGLAVGAIVGFVLSHRSSRVTQLAGVLVAIAWLSGALTYLGNGRPPSSSLIAAVMLATGLIIGGICTRHIRHV